MLLLSNEDIYKVLPIGEAISVLDQAYRDFSEGRAHGTTTRLDTRTTLNDSGRFFSFMSMEGTTPRGDIMALRFNANHEGFVEINGKTKKAHLSPTDKGRYLGLVLLIAMRDIKPLALLHEGYLSVLRVGATSALAAQHLARRDAGEVALLGTGNQARAQLLGLAQVRSLRRVCVYSRNEERRRQFAAEMTEILSVPVVPVADPQSAVKNADLVVAATNSLDPVFATEWLTEGVHVGAIVPGEVDAKIYSRCDLTVVNSKVPFGNERGFIAREDRDWSQFPDLGELVSGRVESRKDESEMTFFMNNAGLGFQFAACGFRAYELARDKGLGREIPSDWLLQPLNPWSTLEPRLQRDWQTDGK